MTGDMYNPRLPADQSLGIDGTPAWAYDEDGYCVCCGNGRWKFHMPDCELADALDMADPVAVIRARVESGTIEGEVVDDLDKLLWSSREHLEMWGDVLGAKGEAGHVRIVTNWLDQVRRKLGMSSDGFEPGTYLVIPVSDGGGES